MGKFVVPTVKSFLKRKRIYDKKKDPVWVYLEREMLENEAKKIKPYNYKVGAWLKFLKDLRYYFFCEAKRKYKRLFREAGPPWYYELSLTQRQVLIRLKDDIHEDVMEDRATRVPKAIWALGVGIKFKNRVLMKCMLDALEDPGIFLWYLYESHYKSSPAELRLYYDMNAMIIMSSLAMLDMEECIRHLEIITKMRYIQTTPPPQKVQKKYYEPKIRYGEYLSKIYVPLITSRPYETTEKESIAPLDYKIKLRREESYEQLQRDTSFIKKRVKKNQQEKYEPRKCKFKFWECPAWVHNTDPKKRAYVLKLKLLKLKAKRKHLKYKNAPLGNEQFHLGTVTYIGNSPRYILNNICAIPTGNSPINGGQVRFGNEFVTLILGHYNTPLDLQERCDRKCNCMEKLGERIMDYVYDSKCKCKHYYDYHHPVTKLKEQSIDKYYNQPTKYTEGWFDRAKIYRMDSAEDVIKYEVRKALKSDTSVAESGPIFDARGLKIKEILAALLADLTNTPLIIPHLPKAHLLNNLQEWVRRRMYGKKLTPRQHRRLLLRAERRWLDLSHMDFRARAYKIPFTSEELAHFNWSHRYLVQNLYTTLIKNFVMRNREKQVKQTRLFWSTMHFDVYPSKTFLEIFFTYMPGTVRDTYLLNQYSPNVRPKLVAQSCPLDLPIVVPM